MKQMKQRKNPLFLIGLFLILVINANAQPKETWMEYEVLEDSISEWLNLDEEINIYKRENDMLFEILDSTFEHFIKRLNYCSPSLKYINFVEKKADIFSKNHKSATEILEQKIIQIERRFSFLVHDLIRRNISTWKEQYNLTAIPFKKHIYYIVNNDYICIRAPQKADLHLEIHQNTIDIFFKKIEQEHQVLINSFKIQDFFEAHPFLFNIESNVVRK
jgi:hypothetical protein